MDFSTSSVPMTDDDELDSLLTGLNQDGNTVTPRVKPVSTPSSLDDIVATDENSTSSLKEMGGMLSTEDDEEPAVASKETLNGNLDDDTLLESPIITATEKDPIEAPLTTESASVVATPDPISIIDQLNAQKEPVTSSITGITEPIEPLEFDQETIDAVSSEIDKQQAVAMGVNETAPDPVEELSALRDKTLNYLSDMIRDINQSPEEKFKTLLTIFRGTSDKSLLVSALETAEQITDSNQRAESLIELVKVIDEFTNK